MQFALRHVAIHLVDARAAQPSLATDELVIERDFAGPDRDTVRALLNEHLAAI